MKMPLTLLILSGLLWVMGVAASVSSYVLPSVYPLLYLGVLAVALVTGLVAYRCIDVKAARSPEAAIGAACVMYWTLAGLKLSILMNDVAFVFIIVLLGGGWIGLARRPRSGVGSVR